MKSPFVPRVLIDHEGHPLIIFGQGRLFFTAIATDTNIRLVQLDTLRGLRPAIYHGEPYAVRKAASFYLNHTGREITKRARAVLRGLVARKLKQEGT